MEKQIKNSATKNSAIFLYLAIILCAATFMFNRSIIQSIVIMACFGLISVANVVFLWNQRTTVQFVIVIFTICLSVLNSYLNGSGYGTVVAFSSLLLLLFLSKNLILSKNQVGVLDLFGWIVILCIAIIYCKKDGIMYVNIFDNNNTRNPNGIVAIYLALGFLSYIVISNHCKLLGMKRFAMIIVFFVMSYAIYNTDARGGLFAWGVFHIVYLIYWLAKRKCDFNKKELKNFMPILSLLIILGALAFTIAYVGLYKIVGDDLIILGKNLFTGRQRIWLDAYKKLFTDLNIFIGFSNHYQFVGTYLNTHNGILSFLCYFGIIPFVFFVYLFTSSFKNTKICYIDLIKCFAIIAFLANCYTEAFIADTSYWWIMIPFFINKYEVEDDKQDYSLLLVRKQSKTKNCAKMHKELA